MIARMDGTMRARVAERRIPLVGVVDGAEERPMPDQEAQIGCEPREREQGEHRADAEAEAIATRPRARAEPAAQEDDDGQGQSEQHADGRDRIRPLGIEVCLVDHPRPEDRAAEKRRHDRQARDPAAACDRRDDREHRDGGERDRPVQEDDDTARAGDPAVVAHVVQLTSRKARIGSEDLRGDDEIDAPQDRDLAQAGADAVATQGHAR
jgi:hypothetical protein